MGVQEDVRSAQDGLKQAQSVQTCSMLVGNPDKRKACCKQLAEQGAKIYSHFVLCPHLEVWATAN